MRKSPFTKSSRLSFRAGLFSAIGVGGVSMGLSYFFFESSLENLLFFGLLLMILTFGIVYAITYRMLIRRMETLNRINRNIARKRFEDYDNLSTGGHDELDYLIKQTIRASKTVEREIQRLNRIENYRKEFIGDISHELKTPIFAIQGFIETLLNGAIDDEEVNRRFLKKAMRNVNRLILLTKDLMEISKLETGELKSEVQSIYLHNVISDVVDNLQYKAQKENVTLEMGAFNENTLVRADRNQIKQVLINLVENAIKYNVAGGSVTVSAQPFSNDPGKMLVSVKDTGIGIDQQYIERVTERFFRIDKSRSREKGGTGLGLAIVKHIMEAHGEEFFIDSAPNEGSTFSFTLTKAEVEQTRPPVDSVG
ncbi:two-component system, OmpR family, phosphate regulon sensor histidine kinase PhoR [Fodinibius roseus]|uniref:histidine kinase n=1 Tax=Fodinibius roseus TaxID=1194090 RepID=A0A1M5ABC3_9BACT|nr:ATP-binding protein [Fodinibius roseus]SHF27454.1 two-component system, OmpR family, phosphate regulon sensor histidine kinase PhoR [Fodinibius roseus]